MDTDDVLHRRLIAQRLWGTPYRSISDALSGLVAVQAQEFGPAQWSLGQRTTRATQRAFDRAFASGAILRTHVLRPTWHFVAPLDIRWLLTLSAPRVVALCRRQEREHALEAAHFRKAETLFHRALEGGRHLTRAELGAVLGRGGIVASGLRLGLIMMRAELDAVVCSGAPRGKQQTYALLDERAPATPTRTRDDALAELAARFFAGRGPATVKDFAWWSGLTMGDCRRAMDTVSPTLESATIGDRTYWFGHAARRVVVALPRVDVLQGYDEYISSYSETKVLLWERSVPQMRRTDRTAFLHAIVLDGRLIGHWRPTSGAHGIEHRLYRRLNGPESRALDAALARYRAFRTGSR